MHAYTRSHILLSHALLHACTHCAPGTLLKTCGARVRLALAARVRACTHAHAHTHTRTCTHWGHTGAVRATLSHSLGFQGAGEWRTPPLNGCRPAPYQPAVAASRRPSLLYTVLACALKRVTVARVGFANFSALRATLPLLVQEHCSNLCTTQGTGTLSSSKFQALIPLPGLECCISLGCSGLRVELASIVDRVVLAYNGVDAYSKLNAPALLPEVCALVV